MKKRIFTSLFCVIAMLVASSAVVFAQNPDDALLDAFEVLSEEVSSRLETSPLAAFGLVGDALEDGVISLQAELLTQDGFTPSVGMSITINSQMSQQRTFVDAQIYARLFGMPIGIFDVQTLTDGGNFAIDSSLFGEEFFGATFEEILNLSLGMLNFDFSSTELSPVEINIMHGARLGEQENLTQVWLVMGEEYIDFYIDSDGRLVEIHFFSEELVVVAQFGSHAKDLWTFAFFTNDGSFWIEWEIEEYQGWWINRFDYGGIIGYGYTDIVWNPASGVFLHYFQDEILFEGTFLITLDGFVLEGILDVGEFVYVAIMTQEGAFVPDVDFANASPMGESFWNIMEEIGEMFEVLLDLLN